VNALAGVGSGKILPGKLLPASVARASLLSVSIHGNVIITVARRPGQLQGP